MVKIMFFDYNHCEIVDGFIREIELPEKYSGNPVFVSGHALEANWFSFYGSVIRRNDGLWQAWYTTILKNTDLLVLGYLESDDGINWKRVENDAVQIDGKNTHFVFDKRPHGAAIIYDEKEERPSWKYKMMCGANPSGCIFVFHSNDGIHWLPAPKGPVIGTRPDCPIGLLRLPDKRYVAYHRPIAGDRRVARSESWDFVNWSEAKVVIDLSPEDPTQIQFYGMGATSYGEYEIGTLWIYHTDPKDFNYDKMEGFQEPELAYSRTGYSWHRLEKGTSWIKRGSENSWECGQIQPASSPVFLENEIRFYYVGTRAPHGRRLDVWDKPESRCGIGFVSIKPDRFAGLKAASNGLLITRPLWADVPKFFINAKIKGNLKVEITDVSGRPVPGFEIDNSLSLTGDSIYHPVQWKNNPDVSILIKKDIRIKIQANDASIYSIMAGSEKEIIKYWEFKIPRFLYEKEKNF